MSAVVATVTILIVALFAVIISFVVLKRRRDKRTEVITGVAMSELRDDNGSLPGTYAYYDTSLVEEDCKVEPYETIPGGTRAYFTTSLVEALEEGGHRQDDIDQQTIAYGNSSLIENHDYHDLSVVKAYGDSSLVEAPVCYDQSGIKAYGDTSLVEFADGDTYDSVNKGASQQEDKSNAEEQTVTASEKVFARSVKRRSVRAASRDPGDRKSRTLRIEEAAKWTSSMESNEIKRLYSQMEEKRSRDIARRQAGEDISDEEHSDGRKAK